MNIPRIVSEVPKLAQMLVHDINKIATIEISVNLVLLAFFKH